MEKLILSSLDLTQEGTFTGPTLTTNCLIISLFMRSFEVAKDCDTKRSPENQGKPGYNEEGKTNMSPTQVLEDIIRACGALMVPHRHIVIISN